MININGVGSISDNVNDDIHVNGAGTIKGEVHSQKVNIDGSANFEEVVNCNELLISGASNFKKIVKAENIKIDGACNFGSDVEVTTIVIDGACNCKGTINSESFVLNGIGNFNEICGEKVDIDSTHKLTKIKSIEATHIEVSGVKCEKISGDDVTVLGNSEVDTIEYRNKLVLSNKIKIKNIVKL